MFLCLKLMSLLRELPTPAIANWSPGYIVQTGSINGMLDGPFFKFKVDSSGLKIKLVTSNTTSQADKCQYI
jgi:hypothetical protein